MGVKLIKKNGKSYAQLPDSFNEIDEIELFQLRGNFWLLSAPLGAKTPEAAAAPPAPKSPLSSEEKSVLQKLMKIRFADRTPPSIEKTFSGGEKETVRDLIKKGLLQVFYGKKYEKTGVYSISNEVYPLISHEESAPAAQPAPAQQGVQPSKPASTLPPSYSELNKAGWLIIPNPRDAEQFSFDLKRAGLSQNVKGVRGFDGRFYVATNKFLYSSYDKIKPVMEKKKALHLEEIAAEASMEPQAVSVIMHLLAESGEIIEKKRDLFCLA